LACDAGLLWQPYYAWNSGRTHRGDKRPPYFKFKTAYKTRLNDTNKWPPEKILNNKKKKMEGLLWHYFSLEKLKKYRQTMDYFFPTTRKCLFGVN
jgi:hypothetical protein